MDGLARFIEWFPNVVKPILAQRAEFEVKTLAIKVERLEDLRHFRQRIFEKFQTEYQREISSSIKERLKRIDVLEVLSDVYEVLWNAENQERFE